MNPKLLRRCLTGALFLGAVLALKYYLAPPLPRVRLPDGTEIRVLKVAYGTGAHAEHDYIRPLPMKMRLWLYLPKKWQHYITMPVQVPTPPVSMRRPSTFSIPVISVWWEYVPPPQSKNQPQLGIPAFAIVETDDTPLQDHPGDTLISGRTHAMRDHLKFILRPNSPDRLVFHRPPLPAKTLTIYLNFNREPVAFTVPIPSENR